MNEETIGALRRVSHTAIATVGDACKNDLITVGKGLGIEELILQREIPELFTSEDDNPSLLNADDVYPSDLSETYEDNDEGGEDNDPFEE